MIDDDTLRRLMTEDVPYGDLTTDLLGIGPQPGRIAFSARGAMVACATEEAARLFELAGARLVGQVIPSSTVVTADAPLLMAEASAYVLHRVWKVAQVLVETLSGIASATRALVDAARAVNPTIAVACTRKSFPGTRTLSVRAIMAGGATPHRLGLSDSLLVFAEHRLFLPAGVPLSEWVGRLKRSAPERKMAVEVGSVEDALAFARAGVDTLQLEKFTPEAVYAVVEEVRRIAPGLVVVAAGGIDVHNAALYAGTGAGVLATSAPYHAKPADVRVSFSGH